MGAQGQVLAEKPVSFVAPRVDPATQLVLVKAIFESLPTLRPDQAVRARVVWSRRDGLAVARRVPLTLGRLGEGEVEVTSGLCAGVQLVVSGVQQLTDGAAVDPRPPAP